jgi:putative DNA primase/helicase
MSLRAADIHARLGSTWPSVLAQLGIAESFLRKKAGPCPACGGTDRFTFDNRNGRGDYFCRHCGAGDGFQLLERVHGWSFSEARRCIMQAIGVSPELEKRSTTRACGLREAGAAGPVIASPPQRVRSIARSACAIADCPDAVTYLASRGLWPLPEACALRAHPGLDYWQDGQRIGRYPGLVAEVRDLAGELVTVHATYLEGGSKVAGYEPRKILSALTGREGCAVRLMTSTETLGIAEGIETALSAAAIDALPVWAALNTSLLAKFDPPAGIERLLIYADRDEAGLIAAGRLMERLQGRIRFELRVPLAPHKDFNDMLTQRNTHE